ncbi:MAG TPA: tetratricopeptide repeat protein [Syntrophorhabdaceae bacterium]|jgi:tetratricopeptide (TPR) repeat protein|nr:tetratricopeptide repeat protein [Pseudomonadota bacterium]OQB74625.1 MAG: lipoprotein NlpI [Deltaproteobacteria bacterium ADurb.Bin135]HPN98667.1 tetratricopeptide repeat protein [Syntrophorhabdaceae bacterium]HQJ95420.1 tetratricopeptide repeat protein [Syntrophorhabdaceae bacterium]
MYRRSISYSIGIASIVMFILHLTLCYACAETKTFIKEYTFIAGEADSKLTSRTVSLREVKRLLLEELGTYLESTTEVKDFKLTKDQIITLTAGIVSAEIMEEKWDGKTYWLKAKISADRESVIKSIDKLRQDRQKVNELEEMRKRSDALLKENEQLKKELASLKDKDHEKTVQQYKKNIDSLTAEEWFDKGYAAATAGNHSEAIDAYTKAIDIKPDLALAYYNRGAAYYNLGQHSRAIEDYNQAIRIKPDYADAYNNRGAAYLSISNTTKGCPDAKKACNLGICEAYEYAKRKRWCR